VTPDLGAPLVSVVIPCFNYGRFLGEAIGSVLDQTYAPLEVIVVDDGSSDDTQAVARSYPVRLITQKNRGVCEAVNLGIGAASGEFVMRLDADDALMDTYIEETMRALQHAPDAAFAYSDGTYIGSRNGTFHVDDFQSERLAEGGYAVCLALMRKSLFERVGGYDVEMAALRCEDWDLWLTFAEQGLWGVRIPKPLWYYRRHLESSRNSWNLVTIGGLLRELRLIARLQDKHGSLYTRPLLFGRIRRIPRRLVHHELSLRQAVLMAIFCSVMLSRSSIALMGKWRAVGER
jgi:glycosyltransferase involved in cell wall biosynthesis